MRRHPWTACQNTVTAMVQSVDFKIYNIISLRYSSGMLDRQSQSNSIDLRKMHA